MPATSQALYSEEIITIEQRVTANTEAINRVISLQADLVSAMKRLEAQHQERMDRMDRQLESMQRFNRGARKLWIAIAKKMDWLDEADWPEDED